MVINPPVGMDKAWENSRPQINDAIGNILSSLGLKSIMDMFAKVTSSPEFQAAMPVMGMALGGGAGMGTSGFSLPNAISETAGRGGGATSIAAPSPAYKTLLQTGQQPQQPRSLSDAINAAMPLMRDQQGIERLSDLLKMLGGS